MKQLYFMLVVFVAITAKAQVSEEEKSELINFYNNNNGTQWNRQDNWLSEKPVSEWYGISTTMIDGMEHVTSIDFTALDSDSNYVSNLVEGEVKLNLPELLILNLPNNQVSAVDLSQNRRLKFLNLSHNVLTAISVQNNLNFISLDLGYNQLTELNLYYSPKLLSLKLNNNNISSIDLSNAVNLQSLDIGDNQLTALDLFFTPDVTYLNLKNNQVESLALHNVPKLEYLNISSNQFESLDISHNKNLESLDVSHNELTSLDLNQNDDLTYLELTENPLITLDLSHQSDLIWLNAYDTTIEMVNLKNYHNYQNSNIKISDRVQCVEVTDPNQAIEWDITWKDGYSNNYKTDCSRYLSTQNWSNHLSQIKLVSPVKDILVWHGKQTVKQIEIFSMMGQKIKVLKDNNRNVADLPSGLYILKITTNKDVQTIKMIKE